MSLGLKKPTDAHHGYGYHPAYAFHGYPQPYPVLMYYSETRASWLPAAFAERDGQEFSYLWPLRTYSC